MVCFAPPSDKFQGCNPLIDFMFKDVCGSPIRGKGVPGKATCIRPVMNMQGSYRLEDQVGFIIRKVSQSHNSIFSAHMIAGLTPTQWAALVKIGENGFITQNQLGRETAMDVATIKGVVERLKIRRLVTVKPDPNDLRRRVITLTRLGQQHLRRGVEKAELITRETLRNLTAAEQRQLHALLLKMC